MSNKEVKGYLEKCYAFDRSMHRSVCKFFGAKDRGLLTGSVAEGAWIYPWLFEGGKVDLDVMMQHGEFSEQLCISVLEKTAYPGYFKIKLTDESYSCLSDHIAKEEDLHYLIGHHLYSLVKGIKGIRYEAKEGSPSVVGYSKNHLFKIDNVPCVHLTFFPEIIDHWFKKKREWPKQEVIDKILLKGCHLVWKEIDTQDTWRLSFSQAEILLANERSDFQQKCYLLAKIIFHQETRNIIDQKSEKQLSSYMLKTTMFYVLEETTEDVWKTLEQEESFFEVVDILFQKLSSALSKGFLPCIFLEKINLLDGLSQSYLLETSAILSNYFNKRGPDKVLQLFKENVPTQENGTIYNMFHKAGTMFHFPPNYLNDEYLQEIVLKAHNEFVRKQVNTCTIL